VFVCLCECVCSVCVCVYVCACVCTRALSASNPYRMRQQGHGPVLGSLARVGFLSWVVGCDRRGVCRFPVYVRQYWLILGVLAGWGGLASLVEIDVVFLLSVGSSDDIVDGRNKPYAACHGWGW
jgi:hypothetical protein